MRETHWFDEAVPILEYTRLPQESGVYAIAHESLPIVYVGVTQSIKKRIKDHIFYNERGEGLPGLAEAWHTYGPEALRVAVLESAVPVVLLRERENYWLRTLAKDYQLLNGQLHSNYANNYELQEVRGVTYLIYGKVPSTIRPLRDKETGEIPGGAGDIFARLEDGITGGGGVGSSQRTFIAAATNATNLYDRFTLGVTLTRTLTLATYRTPEEMLTSFVTHSNRGSELVFSSLDYQLRHFLPTLETLADDGYKAEVIVDGHGRAVHVKITRHNQTWYMRDIYALLPMPDRDLSILTGVDKSDTISEKMHVDASNPGHKSDLRRDVELLFTSYREYTRTLRECYGITPGYTAGGTALRAFRRMITHQQQRAEVEKFVRRAYFGGLLFLIWVRSHQNVFKLDVNTACATAMRKQKEGDTSGCWTSNEWLGRPGIYLCEIDCPKDLPCPFVPARSDYDTIWPTRTFRTYLCSYTIALARVLGYSIEVVQGFAF